MLDTTPTYAVPLRPVGTTVFPFVITVYVYVRPSIHTAYSGVFALLSVTVSVIVWPAFGVESDTLSDGRFSSGRSGLESGQSVM